MSALRFSQKGLAEPAGRYGHYRLAVECLRTDRSGVPDHAMPGLAERVSQAMRPLY